MTQKNKKEKELKILRTVFKKKRYPKYTFHERPDFIVHHMNDFGVEITEFYPDETVARMVNMPNYAEKVTEKSYIHKDDINKLEVVNTEYFNKKKKKWIKIEQPAVRQENMPIHERITVLLSKIKGKSELLNSYDKSLENIDLIIYDGRSSMIDGINDEYMRKTIREMYSLDVFEKSGYRNIYLSIPLHDGRPAEVIKLK